MKLTKKNIEKALTHDDTEALDALLTSYKHDFFKILNDDFKSYFIRVLLKVLNTPSLRKHAFGYMDNPLMGEIHQITIMLSELNALYSYSCEDRQTVKQAIFDKALNNDDDFMRLFGCMNMLVDVLNTDARNPFLIFGYTELKTSIFEYIINHATIFQKLITDIESLSNFCNYVAYEEPNYDSYAKKAITIVLKDPELQTKMLKDHKDRTTVARLILQYNLLTQQAIDAISKEVVSKAQIFIQKPIASVTTHSIFHAKQSQPPTEEKPKDINTTLPPQLK